jgi:hypothetical protein
MMIPGMGAFPAPFPNPESENIELDSFAVRTIPPLLSLFSPVLAVALACCLWVLELTQALACLFLC